MPTSITIETFLPKHWEEVQIIYESGIKTGIATFETVTPTWENWDKSHLPFSRFVAKQQQQIVGWAALSPVSTRFIYRGVAEVSIYVAEGFKGQGIGTVLLHQIIESSETNNIWTLQAGIFTENVASVKLHESLGFRMIGYREKVGKLKDSWKDNYLLERRSKKVGID
jgi:L-amino acid N-acyltransferase YncA